MVRVFTPADAKRLSLPGRTSHEILSANAGAAQMTLRRVEIEVPRPGETRRGPHVHRGFEECIHVVSGQGVMESEDGVHPVAAGDTILVPSGERHVTHNTGGERLVLLCFFPVSDVAAGTTEFASWAEAKAAS